MFADCGRAVRPGRSWRQPCTTDASDPTICSCDGPVAAVHHKHPSISLAPRAWGDIASPIVAGSCSNTAAIIQPLAVNSVLGWCVGPVPIVLGEERVT